jgi:hypothetical protein
VLLATPPSSPSPPVYAQKRLVAIAFREQEYTLSFRHEPYDRYWPRWYQAGVFRLTLHVTQARGLADSWEMSGMLIDGQQFAGRSVFLRCSGIEQQAREQKMDQYGSFLFLNVQAAVYMLEVWLPEYCIVIEQLLIGD